MTDVDDYSTLIEKYRDCLKKESSIKMAVSYAEKEMTPYVEYLE